MEHMFPNYFSNAKNQNAKKNAILNAEHDFEQCAQIPFVESFGTK
jgi:hypothetical protein